MSKIGYKPIPVDSGVTVTVEGQDVKVMGPKGTISLTLPDKIRLELKENTLFLTREGELKQIKSLHGTYRSHLANAMLGVTKGWEKRLEVVGTGFGVSIKEGNAVFKVGYSHQVTFNKVDGLQFTTEGQATMIISGIDKQLVGEIAHKVREIKKPDAYKGKGIRYVGEVIKLKAGKKTKTT